MPSRRDFLKITTASTLALATTTTAPHLAAQPSAPAGVTATSASDLAAPNTTREGDMLFRTLGKTNEKVSLIGLGGFHIGVPKPEDDGIKLIRRAIDAGINFMDNSWDYHNGKSETRMGNALKDGYRKKIFLMTKFNGRTKESANQQIEESLKRLQVDVIDLIQIHEVIRVEDPDRCFAKGGAMEACLAAKKAGKVRYIGFTGHKDPFIHLRTLEVAKKHGFNFDTVQMPVNLFDSHFRSFTNDVLPLLVKEQIGVLGMKSLAGGHILKTNTVSATDCLHFAMTMPTSVVITGIDSEKILDQALEAVKTFKPLTKDQIAGLLQNTKNLAMTGEHEPFKTTTQYDSTTKNPQQLG
jgi:aryl-alcohol dehydrogenase-like predicted oxidoreductase